jgi:hypothetical protein
MGVLDKVKGLFGGKGHDKRQDDLAMESPAIKQEGEDDHWPPAEPESEPDPT